MKQYNEIIRLLIVDDHSETLEMLTKFFSPKIFSLTTVSNASHALEELKKNIFHVVLTDIKMPDMDGNELLKRIIDYDPKIAVILFTGFGTVEGAVEALKLGAHDYFPKPINLDKLEKSIKNAYHYYSLETKVDELSWLNLFTNKLNTIDNSHELLTFLLHSCLNELDSNSGSIFIYNDAISKLKLIVATGSGSVSILNKTQKPTDGVAGYVAKSKKPLLVEDITKDKRFTKRNTNRYTNNSFLCIPLLNYNNLIGIINIHNKNNNLPFTKNDLDKISVLANHSSAAIERIRLTEKLKDFNSKLNKKVSEATKSLANTNKKLQIANNYIENIISNLSIGLIVFSKHFKIDFYNSIAKNLLSQDYLDHHSSNIGDFPITKSGSNWKKDISSFFKKNSMIIYNRAKLEKSNNEIIPVSLRTSFIKDHKNAILGGMLLIEDITEKIELENKLIISERAAFIGELSAKVAHEINNPIDGSIRYLRLAKDKVPQNDRVALYLDQSLQGLNRIVSVVKGLLDFSRRSYLPKEPTSLQSIIDEALSSLDHIRAAQNIKVKKTIPTNLPQVKKGDLYHLFINLLKNAYQSMHMNAYINITAAKKDHCIHVCINDNGSGMSQETLENIFEPFYTTKEPGQGTGLGMTICYDIIQRYGGKIDISSKLGKGTNISIELPFIT
ncbi:response regulator [Chlamydiota bacterium]